MAGTALIPRLPSRLRSGLRQNRDFGSGLRRPLNASTSDERASRLEGQTTFDLAFDLGLLPTRFRAYRPRLGRYRRGEDTLPPKVGQLDGKSAPRTNGPQSQIPPHGDGGK